MATNRKIKRAVVVLESSPELAKLSQSSSAKRQRQFTISDKRLVELENATKEMIPPFSTFTKSNEVFIILYIFHFKLKEERNNIYFFCVHLVFFLFF